MPHRPAQSQKHETTFYFEFAWKMWLKTHAEGGRGGGGAKKFALFSRCHFCEGHAAENHCFLAFFLCSKTTPCARNYIIVTNNYDSHDVLGKVHSVANKSSHRQFTHQFHTHVGLGDLLSFCTSRGGINGRFR